MFFSLDPSLPSCFLNCPAESLRCTVGNARLRYMLYLNFISIVAFVSFLQMRVLLLPLRVSLAGPTWSPSRTGHPCRRSSSTEPALGSSSGQGTPPPEIIPLAPVLGPLECARIFLTPPRLDLSFFHPLHESRKCVGPAGPFFSSSGLGLPLIISSNNTAHMHHLLDPL